MNVNVINKSDFELPKYETEGSAGMDIKADLKRYFDQNEEARLYYETSDKLTIKPFKVYMIPTGLFIALPKMKYPDGSMTRILCDLDEEFEMQIRPRSGLAAKYGITIMNTPATIDCFEKETNILTNKGEKTIDKLKINDIVYSCNDDLEIEKDIIVAIVDKGFGDVLNIELEDGTYLKITENTEIFTNKGKIFAKELTLEHEILKIN